MVQRGHLFCIWLTQAQSPASHISSCWGRRDSSVVRHLPCTWSTQDGPRFDARHPKWSPDPGIVLCEAHTSEMDLRYSSSMGSHTTAMALPEPSHGVTMDLSSKASAESHVFALVQTLPVTPGTPGPQGG